MHYLQEALFVGLLTGIVGLIVSTAMMVLFECDFQWKKYTFWHWVLLSYMITGFLIHVLCEKTLLNKWYCKHGYACQKRVGCPWST